MRQWPVFALCVLACTGVASVAEAAPKSEQAYERALDAVIEDVADPEKSFVFAEEAIRVGDLRGALSAFERMLLIDPRLANIQLELGVLYLRLGNPQLGRHHLAQALRSPNVPSTVRARAESYLSEAVALTRRNFFFGSIYSGYRHQSNANAGPDSPIVSIFDPFTGLAVPGQLSEEALERKDSSMEAGGSFGHAIALGSSGRTAWASRLDMSGSRYSDLGELDGFSLRLETGPQFTWLASPRSRWTFRLYGVAAEDQLDGEDFVDASGGGFELQRAGGVSSTTRLRVQLLDQEFRDRFDVLGTPELIVSDRSGEYLTADFAQFWQAGRLQVGLLLNAEQADAEAGYQSYSRYGGGGSLRWFFGRPGRATTWSLFATVLRREASYDAPFALAFIGPDVTREDERLDATLGAEISFGRGLSVQIVCGATENDSNLPNYAYDNSTGSVFLTWRF